MTNVNCICNKDASYATIIMMEVTGKGRACIPEGIIKTYKIFNEVCLKSRRRKIYDWP